MTASLHLPTLQLPGINLPWVAQLSGFLTHCPEHLELPTPLPSVPTPTPRVTAITYVVKGLQGARETREVRAASVLLCRSHHTALHNPKQPLGRNN